MNDQLATHERTDEHPMSINNQLANTLEYMRTVETLKKRASGLKRHALHKAELQGMSVQKLGYTCPACGRESVVHVGHNAEPYEGIYLCAESACAYIKSGQYLETEDACKLIGINYRRIDTAIPYNWSVTLKQTVGRFLNASIVWSYEGGSIYGEPIALTDEARRAIEAYNRMYGTRYRTNGRVL